MIDPTDGKAYLTSLEDYAYLTSKIADKTKIKDIQKWLNSGQTRHRYPKDQFSFDRTKEIVEGTLQRPFAASNKRVAELQEIFKTIKIEDLL
jgi:hypothetical protein